MAHITRKLYTYCGKYRVGYRLNFIDFDSDSDPDPFSIPSFDFNVIK